MIKIGDKVRCVKDVYVREKICIVEKGAKGIVINAFEGDDNIYFSVEWYDGNYKRYAKRKEMWNVREDYIEVIDNFKGKNIEIDDDGTLYWNEGNGDEIIGNVKYLDRDVLIDVVKTLVDERDDYKVENYMLEDDIHILKDEIEDLRDELGLYID